MKASVFRKGSLRALFANAMKAFGMIAPVADRVSIEMYARDAFELAASLESESMRSGVADIAKSLLKDAGHDVNTDAPYQEFFGLEGGKAEFDAKFQRSPDATADGPVRLGPQ